MDENSEENKIYNWQLNERVHKIVEKLRTNKYSTDEKEVLYNLIQKVLLNENSKVNKSNLLNVIEDVQNYKDPEINNYISITIDKIIQKYPQNRYIVIKDKLSSSNHSIVSNLMKYGYFENDSIIKYSSKNSIILIIDDYVGSGKTIIDILKEIEKKYINQIVVIISGIWQKKAIDKINEYIIEESKSNNYKIYSDNSIIENSYIEKYEDNDEMLKYIKNTCCTCKDKRYKFGYNNTGAMVIINGLSPNNNISMLWRNDLGTDKVWIPPFNRDINTLVMLKKKERIISESYSHMIEYYNNFCYKELFSFDEFKMLLLIFNSYYIRIDQLTKLLGLDTDSDTEQIIEKFKQYGIIKYEIDNILEFIDKKVIYQFKNINKQISRYALDGLKKECTNNLKL